MEKHMKYGKNIKYMINIYSLMKEEGRLTLIINKNMLKWIKEQMELGEFDSQSAGIRKCILIARRVYEKASPDEIVKFIHGRDIGTE